MSSEFISADLPGETQFLLTDRFAFVLPQQTLRLRVGDVISCSVYAFSYFQVPREVEVLMSIYSSSKHFRQLICPHSKF